MKRISQAKEFDDPLASLKVSVWVDKREYKKERRLRYI